jgi:hypothetical protein
MKLPPILPLIALAASGCSTLNIGAGKKESAPAAVAAPGGEGDIVVGALAEAALPKGECGMILWTLDGDKPAPILRVIAGKNADMNINGAPVKLAITGAEGASGFGVTESQTLTFEGFTATVSVRFGLGFDGGSYLERGLVTVESASGWRTVIPAAGVAGCRS